MRLATTPSSASCCLTSPALSSLVEDLDDPGQALAVHLDHRRHEVLRGPARHRVGQLLDLRGQLLDPLDQGLGADRFGLSAGIPRAPAWAQDIPVGVWVTFRTCPPRWLYMWTPHGRHGSKLRTARMMSTPLKFSGPFSSKIGVFCTASS